MKFTNDNGTLTVFLSGDIDHHTARPMREKTDERIMRDRPGELVLDFTGVTFMDSSGVGLVMGRYKYAAAHGCKTAVKGLKERDKRIMLMSGLAKLVEFR